MRKKRYGPVHNRGVRVKPWNRKQDEESPRAPQRFSIRGGTDCHVRKLNSKGEWRPHRTRQPLTCSGFLWRNETYYGFAYKDWEIKVAVGKFTVKETE